ncbi:MULTISPECIES: hypothetical protein [unclassified Streptomyces]|uniref:toxin-antitoxin system YwqK family antitoxin n=1 Tax=unclassified Streptomyces TaxID=2593676 RepID=UPI0019D2A856|nr:MULTISPECIES: hypothetical protein [unclassified Streptomyces]
MRRIDIDDPEVDMDVSERPYYRGEPFTGEVTDYLTESLVSLDTYVGGYRDGPSRQWYKDGTLRSEGALRAGLPVGEFKTWHPNGVLAAKGVLVANGMTLVEDCAWTSRAGADSDLAEDLTAFPHPRRHPRPGHHELHHDRGHDPNPVHRRSVRSPPWGWTSLC